MLPARLLSLHNQSLKKFRDVWIMGQIFFNEIPQCISSLICGLIRRVEFRVNYNQSVNTVVFGESKPGKYTVVNWDSLCKRRKKYLLTRQVIGPYCIKMKWNLWSGNSYWSFKDQPPDCDKELVLFTPLYIPLCSCKYIPFKCNLGPGSSQISTTFKVNSFVSN